MTMRGPRRSGLRKVALHAVRFAYRLALSAVAVAVLLALVVLLVLPRATQGSAMTVLTGSMTPGIPVGSVVFVRPTDPATLQVGDVATYQKERREAVAYVTHRIVEIDTATHPVSYVFKGDANPAPDPKPVPANAIKGEVWFHVPYLGSVRDALNGKAGLSLLATLVLGGYAVTQVAGAVRDRRRARRTAGSTPGEVETPLVSDRPVVVAELPADQTETGDLDAVVLSSSGSTVTVLAAPAPDALHELLRSLEARGATVVRVIDAGTSGALVTSTHLPDAAASKDATHAQV